MKPDINEMRVRAAKFSMDWNDAKNENRETQSFYNDFFRIFGINRREVADFEEPIQITKKRKGYIDLFWPKVLLVEQKSAGLNLDEAEKQADRYYGALPSAKKPHYRLVCDFQNFRLFDYIDEEEIIRFPLAKLKENIKYFEFILDHTFEAYKKQETVSIRASNLMGQIYKTLVDNNYKDKKLEIFLTRLTFCLFADNTGIFNPPRLFQNLIYQTDEDGRNTAERIVKIFEILDRPETKRENNLDEDLARLPYVNGGLFEERIDSPTFDFDMRLSLIHAGGFDWSEISPAVFGNLFQMVMDAEERHEQGAHYTNERDILKVINPLFMDDLQTEFEQIKKRKTIEERTKLLEVFQNKLASMTFFDPACGCGNFLVIAYRELRKLEIKVLKLLHQKGIGGEQTELDARQFSKIDVHQFYGLELNDFAVHIARAALWMMDHFMNRELSEELGQVFSRIPLEKSPTIICADALDTDWADLLPPEQCSFIFGNPPFKGGKRTDKQNKQMRILTNLNGKTAKSLDYVCAWFLKSATYVRTTNKNIPFAFVATNSITQGQHVSMLWERLLHEHKLDIIFAHQTFAWESEASGKAHVHVVIIGLEKQEHLRKDKKLFSYKNLKGEPIEKLALAISPYLFDACKLKNPKLIIHGLSKPVTPRPIMTRGPQPTDDGHYIFHDGEITDFLKKEPKAKKFMRPYIGAKELIYNLPRVILDLEHAEPDEIQKMPLVKKRIAKVVEFREACTSKQTKLMAEYPRKFLSRRIPQKPFLIIPRVSSENRRYIPMAYAKPPVIPSDAVIYLEGENTLCMLSLLTSAMHMAWVQAVAGRLKSDFRYSNTITYNTFPLPNKKDIKTLAPLGQAILDARANHPKATLANLYDLITMPDDLHDAHKKNDAVIDKLYRAKDFTDNADRIAHLFALYEKQTAQ